MHTWDDRDDVAEWFFSGARLFDSKFEQAGGLEFSDDYFHERYGQFGGRFHDEMEPEHVYCTFPTGKAMDEAWPNPVLIPLCSLTVVHDEED